MAREINAYVPDGYTASLIASNHIRQQITEQLQRGEVAAHFGQIQDDGTVPVQLRADANSFDLRGYFDVPQIDGIAWIDADSTSARVDYQFEGENQPISFLMQHEASAE